VTPTRLREIADRMERVCSNYQEKVGAGYKACRGCKNAADELRILAGNDEPLAASVSKASKSKCAVEFIDHQPAGPRDAA
jgi:hypothetical protein